MLKEIKELGEYKTSTGASGIEPFLEIPYKDKEGSNYFFIPFEIQGDGTVKYKGSIEVEPIHSEDEYLTKYLYDAISSGSGIYGSPTAKFTELEKTLPKKIKNFFGKNNIKKFEITDEEKDFLESIRKEFENNYDAISNDLNELLRQAGKKNVIGVLFYDKDGTKKYIGEIKTFVKIFEQFIANKLDLIDGTCFLCGKKGKVTVNAISKVAFFYSIDKPGFIVGGFNRSEAYKDFAICPECFVKVQLGTNLLENDLTFKFYGLRYWLIPNFFLSDKDKRKEILDILIENKNKNIGIKSGMKRLTDDEREILDIISDLNDYVSFNFLFYAPKGNGRIIKALIEDVLPSRLHTIFEAKKRIDSLPIVETITHKKTVRYFDFGYIREFFKGTKGDTKNKEFLAIIDSIFKDKLINKGFFLNFVMSVLRKSMANDDYFSFKTKEAFVSFLFLKKLRLIKEDTMDDLSNSAFEEIFNRFDNSFGTNLSRGLFLLGAATGMLESIQMSERNTSSPPIDKKLKNLKLTEKDVLSLLPELEVKFKQYKSWGKDKQLVLKEAAGYLLAAGRNWKMSVDEINFYIAAGLLYKNEIRSIAQQKTNGGDKNE